MELTVYNLQGEKVGELEGSQKIFAVEPKPQVLQQAVVWYQASQRRGTQATLTKGEVRGGGRKPWRQKGTGRARQGSIRSPLWRKGGVIFGPKPRSYGYALPKKIRKLAICMALSDRAKEGRILVVDNWQISPPKTKEAVKILQNLKINRKEKNLVVLSEGDESFFRAARNIAGVKVIFAKDLNIYDLLNCQQLMVSREIFNHWEEKLQR